jgi:hypothetical protein
MSLLKPIIGELTMPEANLTMAIKQAKSKKMFFAFVPKGSEGKLLVSKTKIPPKEIADAKKEIGGGAPVTGKCFGDGSGMVFQVAKQAAPTLAPALKKVVKRDTGLTIDPDVRQAGNDAEPENDADDDVQDIDQEAESAEEDADAGEFQAKAAADKAAIMKRLTALVGTYKEAVANNGPNAQRLQALLATVKTCLGKQQFAQASEGLDKLEELLSQTTTPSADVDEEDDVHSGAEQEEEAPAFDLVVYQAARQMVVKGLKALAAKAAATKHHSAAGVLKEINFIIARLPANPGPHEIDKLEDFIRNDETITAADKVPDHFHDLDIRASLLKAWKR